MSLFLPRCLLAVLGLLCFVTTGSGQASLISTLAPRESMIIAYGIRLDQPLPAGRRPSSKPGTIRGHATRAPNHPTRSSSPNDPPVVDLNGVGGGNDETVNFTEQIPELIAPAATITDTENDQILFLTATLTARPDGDGVESLSLDATATAAASGFAVSYTPGTGELTVSGPGTLATYQTIVQGILYNNTSDNPLTVSRSVTVVVDDSIGGPSDTRTSTITVTSVNDAPSFTKGADQIVKTNVGSQTVTGWATAISPGPDESSQTVDFIVSNDNNGLFSSQPAISASGDLTFTPALDATGKATVTVQIHDDAGTSPGVDTSASQTFTIEVMAVPLRPGYIIVADRGPFVATGKVLVVNPADGSQQIISTALKDPYGISLEANGNIVVADYETFSIFGTGGLYRMNRYSLARTTISSGGNFATPFGVAIEATGNILVADLDAFTVGAVFRVNPSTGAQFTLATGGNFYWLRGITVNTNTGDIYVTDLISPTPGSESVIQINPNTGAQTILSSGVNFNHPDGMAIEYSSGDIIVAEAVNKMIIRVDKTTGAQTVISSDAQFIQPTQVAVDPVSGDFYVTDGISTAGVGERRLYRVDKNTGVATIISVDTFFDQPRGLVVVP